ncbi:conserved hypothetical protein [Ricinus communis]|uniref:Uncharacterized protein n=1 Tax=Ricinus communis TaxID=3988 RepID=B9S9I7_RICCO|nr:conserved hypothetical protein [Ricinus communis]
MSTHSSRAFFSEHQPSPLSPSVSLRLAIFNAELLPGDLFNVASLSPPLVLLESVVVDILSSIQHRKWVIRS